MKILSAIDATKFKVRLRSVGIKFSRPGRDGRRRDEERSASKIGGRIHRRDCGAGFSGFKSLGRGAARIKFRAFCEALCADRI